MTPEPGVGRVEARRGRLLGVTGGRDPDRAWIDDMAGAYERGLVATVFRPFALELADRVAGWQPRRVLELAAGSGALTRELVARGLDVDATDLSAAMVEVGAERAPGARWRAADAQELPFEDGTFDVVVCQFGAMFFPDRVGAFGEARRVLVEGGRLLVATWGALDRHTFQGATARALERVLPGDPPRYLDLPHSCHDPDRLAAEVAAAGFGDVVAEVVAPTTTAESLVELTRGYCLGTPLRVQLEDRGDLDELVDQVVQEVASDLGPDPVTGTMEAVLVSARG